MHEPTAQQLESSNNNNNKNEEDNLKKKHPVVGDENAGDGDEGGPAAAGGAIGVGEDGVNKKKDISDDPMAALAALAEAREKAPTNANNDSNGNEGEGKATQQKEEQSAVETPPSQGGDNDDNNNNDDDVEGKKAEANENSEPPTTEKVAAAENGGEGAATSGGGGGAAAESAQAPADAPNDREDGGGGDALAKTDPAAAESTAAAPDETSPKQNEPNEGDSGSEPDQKDEGAVAVSNNSHNDNGEEEKEATKGGEASPPRAEETQKPEPKEEKDNRSRADDGAAGDAGEGIQEGDSSDANGGVGQDKLAEGSGEKEEAPSGGDGDGTDDAEKKADPAETTATTTTTTIAGDAAAPTADGGAAAKPEEARTVKQDPAAVDTAAEPSTPKDEAVKKEEDGAGVGGGEEAQKKDSEPSATGASAEADEPSSTTAAAAAPAAGGTAPPPADTGAAAAADAPAAAAAPLPVMKGTLSYEKELHRHLIRGMWNYEGSSELAPQRFELVRTLSPTDKLEVLPQDGVFHGSFSLAYMHVTSKGKKKERSKVIQETGVQMHFKPIEGKDREFAVDGKGTNQFGVFHINGTATPSKVAGDPTLHIVLKKQYEQQPTPAPATATGAQATNISNIEDGGAAGVSASDNAQGPLPDPSPVYDKGIVCLRGKLLKEEANTVGPMEGGTHRITGMWASGLNLLLDDPDNKRGLANRFEYEHKSSVPSKVFPISGKYTGWFDLTNDDGSRTKISERDVTLKFRKNKAGAYNVEGKGSNLFGRYSISGSLSSDNVITIFRHFQPRKIKNKSISVASGSAGALSLTAGGTGSLARRPSVGTTVEPKFKLGDVKLPPEAEEVTENGQSKLEALAPPEHHTYSAVSRGVLRLNDDGSHSCQGKWAVTRDQLTNGDSSKFQFRLESHFVAEALTEQSKGTDGSTSIRSFPLDSAMYKGFFHLKKGGGTRYQTIVDQQVVMKFRENLQGSYNVYGKGFNAIGEFNLVGTMVMVGKTGGQVELYRMYIPEKMASAPTGSTATKAELSGPASTGGAARLAAPSSLPGPPPPAPLQRRESTRLVKLPSKLEDDDPSAILSRTMSKCAQILRQLREKDVETGNFFSEPVDPVALGIPTYRQIIKEPMDLGTVHSRMEAGNIENPEEFARLMRLVFQNAMNFNVDPAHSVHQAARALLVLFNQRFREVEMMLESLRRVQDTAAEKGKKDGKKRKRQADEPPKSLKRQRIEEAQAMASSNESAIASILAAAPTSSSPHVTRTEFAMLLSMIQQLQKQVVQTHTAVAELSPGDETDAKFPAVAGIAAPSAATAARSVAPERKKSTKRKAEAAPVAPQPVVDDAMPLTLQEQETLTETINELPPEHLGAVIQIIREAAPVGADEEEIDLEIDQLDTKTQRKLLRHVMKVSFDGEKVRCVFAEFIFCCW